MNSGLTINQEKKIRLEKLTNPAKRIVDLEGLATCVQQYRRAQRLNTPGSMELRKDLVEEIDKRLLALGL